MRAAMRFLMVRRIRWWTGALPPSACIGDDYAYFEPVHGTAPDLTGKNIINPTAMLLSAKWMLDYLGFTEAAERLEKAVYQVYAEGKRLTQ